MANQSSAFEILDALSAGFPGFIRQTFAGSAGIEEYFVQGSGSSTGDGFYNSLSTELPDLSVVALGNVNEILRNFFASLDSLSGTFGSI